jgi:CRISPR-associated endonuclease/helicase Cas3
MTYTYSQVYLEATGKAPFPYQLRLTEDTAIPNVIKIPTGLGKTSAIILAWIWRRFFAEQDIRSKTPRRLVYCLPMRTLVEQTKTNVENWFSNLEKMDGFTKPEVTIFMGGEDATNWDIYPEENAVIIGTQDMLLSRALNRGYGMSKYRWPVHFGLLNNDCLWVLDEVQLMGVGAKTGNQLQEFRKKYGNLFKSHTVRMSATIADNGTECFELQDADYSNHIVKKRVDAQKSIEQIDRNEIIDSVMQAYSNDKKVVLIVNTVKSAKEFYRKIRDKLKEDNSSCILLHSRFRPHEKEELKSRLFTGYWKIAVSTQVIEAGVDITSDVMFTEVAPWSSMVQRFGRCNRNGESEDARIYWFDVEKKKVAPYMEQEVDDARQKLNSLSNASLQTIKSIPIEPANVLHVIRDNDIVDLFDTSSDLSGNEVDVSRFIREGDNKDVSVFWRDIPDGWPSKEIPAPSKEEICQVPIGEFKEILKKDSWESWVWDYYEGKWNRAVSSNITPNSLILIKSASGGYTPEYGWDLKSKSKVEPISVSRSNEKNESYGQNLSDGKFQSIAEHTQRVQSCINQIVDELELDNELKHILNTAALWHDVGKAHDEFQKKIDSGKEYGLLAKAPKDKWKNNGASRKFFRHELASALCALQNNTEDIVAYLAAAHHGKVRLSIRSLPNEEIPIDSRLFARGVWDGDIIPEIDLGELKVPETRLDLSYMQLGEGPRGESWTSRMLNLRDEFGIFKLAYLEALLKAADERASMENE